jgi:hypothetical protein
MSQAALKKLPEAPSPAAKEPQTAPAPAASGWNPYEVWRTRVFLPLTSGYNSRRGNS